MNRTTFNKAVVPGLFAYMMDGYKNLASKEQWKKILNGGATRGSKRAYEEAVYAAGLGQWAHKPEGEAITYDEFVQGPTKRWTHKTYGLGVKITEELIEDSLYKEVPTEMRQLVEELGRSAAETLAILTWDMINDGPTGTNHKDANGDALFLNTHSFLAGGTWSNLLTPAADLSATALQTAIDNFETTKDEAGRYQILKAGSILVHPNNAWKAKELLNSAFDPESANNSVNTIKERNLSLIVSPYLTDTDAWTLMTQPANRMYGIVAFSRRRVTFAKDGDFETGDSKFKGTFRFSVESAKANNFYHSAGA